MMIHIHGAKGKKDRMVPLSKVLLETLREYYLAYHHKEWIFENPQGGWNRHSNHTRTPWP